MDTLKSQISNFSARWLNTATFYIFLNLLPTYSAAFSDQDADQLPQDSIEALAKLNNTKANKFYESGKKDSAMTYYIKGL